MATLITNGEADNHHTYLLSKLQESTEAYFAVAFLKSAGLTLLLPAIEKFLAAGKRITLVAGQHFALTEPKALYTLRELFRGYPTCKVYLAKATSPTAVFHPKMYLFRTEAGCHVISGSANLTKGGLLSNSECSLAVQCPPQDELWTNAINVFGQLTSPANADEATTLIIKQYETFFEQQKAANQKVKPTPPPLTAFFAGLRKQFSDKFDNAKREANYSARIKRYQDAEAVLNQIADSPRLTEQQFAKLLDRLVGSKGQIRLWYSGSLFRLRRSVYPYFRQFRELVRYIREHRHAPAATVFDGAMHLVQAIEGASVNYVTEIMMTYNPAQFANLNKNPLTTLHKHGAVNIKGTAAAYNGGDYKVYCELVQDVASLLGLKSMLEADSFFDVLYWQEK